MTVLEGLKPEKVFYFFEKLCEIPHGSTNMKEISDYLVSFAKERNLKYYQDEAYNVVIYKEASAGYEDAPITILQGHCDMVAEKTPDSNHDFTKDGLKLKVEGDYLTAEGTTLGGDDGIAVAYMLAILDDDTLKHPALECVITTDEEIGLLGAKALDTSVLKGTHMINMDSEEEGYLWISCAGGLSGTSRIPVEYQEMAGVVTEVLIDGLNGGHSGAEIDKNRANANKLMGLFLYELGQKTAYSIKDLSGGTKDNAITRECEMSLIYADSAEAQKAEKLACDLAEVFADEITSFEPDFSCEIAVTEGQSAMAVQEEDAKAFVSLMRLAPNGIYRRNIKMNGFVVVSSNMGVVRTEEDYIMVAVSPRSSVASLQEDTKSRFALLAETFGFEIEYSGEYPGWSYAEESKIRDLFVESYRDLFGSELRLEAIHAGLECGLFSEAIPGLDAIAVGPTLNNVHTPDENAPLDSLERFYELLKDVLSRLARA